MTRSIACFLALVAVAVALHAQTPSSRTGGAGGGGGTVAVQQNGSAVGSRATIDVLDGTGISTTAIDTGTKITLQPAANTAVLLTRAQAQSGGDSLCSATFSSSAATCTMSPTLAAYTTNMLIQFKPGTDCPASPTLNIDTLGAKALRKTDGTSDLTCTAGRQMAIWYDGTVFREQSPSSSVTSNVITTTSSSGTTFTGTMAPALTAYATGMTVQWKPNQACSGSPTLNINALGAIDLVEAGGVTAITCTSGHQYTLWYDGAKFRKQSGSSMWLMQGLNGSSSPNVAAASTQYVPFTGSVASSTSKRASRIQIAGVVTEVGMGFTSVHTDPSMTCTVVKSSDSGSNWSNTGVSITITNANTSAAPTISATIPKFFTSSTTFSVAAGDLMSWECVNGSASVSASYYISFATIRY